MTDTVLVYRGRPITDLAKDELVDAMTWAFQEIEYQRERADRFLNAAALAEPVPEIPTDEELHELLREVERSWSGEPEIDFARAVLARWGNHPESPDSSAQPS
jgi:hypothetical protein